MPHGMHKNALAPGVQLLWYRIDRILGQGATGITYLATDVNLDRRVAIKEYLPEGVAGRDQEGWVRPLTDALKSDYEQGLERFVREAQILDRFEHPNIVNVLDIFETGNTAYFVMPYERGQSLKEILKQRGPVDEAELMRIILPILEGLEAVHRRDFIHRDIKPANIFVREDGSPVLLDFGAARPTDSAARGTVTTFVSPGYAPIEQYSSQLDQQGPWTDIYGLGATLYRAITGQGPIPAMDRSAAITNANYDTLIPCRDATDREYSRELLAAVDHALAFRAADRPQSIAHWRQELTGAASPGSADDDDDPVTIKLPDGRTPLRVSRAHGGAGALLSRAQRGRETTLSFLANLAEAWLPGFRTLLLASLVLATFVGLAVWIPNLPSPPSKSEAVPPADGTAALQGQDMTEAWQRLNEALSQISEEVVTLKAQINEPAAVTPTATAAEATVAAAARAPETASGDPAPGPVYPGSFAEDAVRIVAVHETTTPAVSPPPAAEPGPHDAEIARLLAAAQGDLKRVRLSTPKGDNALEKYRAVLALDPDNSDAERGIQGIVKAYVDLIDHALDVGALSRAQRYLARAEAIDAEHPGVRRARQTLAARRTHQQQVAVNRENPSAAPPEGNPLKALGRKLKGWLDLTEED